MSIDLSQFHQVFFEESFENLDIMETSLMDLDIDDVDNETVNAVFRAAHSIKGGSATFGFSAISEFTHILETLLDQIRAGSRSLSRDDVDLFLQSVDCIREMLSLLQNGEDADTELSKELTDKFSGLLNDEGETEEPQTEETIEAESVETLESQTEERQDPLEQELAASSEDAPWCIFFCPNETVFMTGNDPLRLVRELRGMGESRCITNAENLPDFFSLDPEKSYLSWDVELKSDARKSDIEEIFEWVVDDAEICIEKAGYIEEKPLAVQEQSESDAIPENSCAALWQIDFHPSSDIFRTGNDPLKLIEALGRLGRLHSIETKSHLPSFSSFDAEMCFLRWGILLEADSEIKQDIDEIFEWVADDAFIDVKCVSGVFSDLAEHEVELQIVSENEKEQQASLAVVENNESAPETTLKSPESDTDKKAELEVASTAKTKETAAAPKAKAKVAVNAEASSIRVGIDKVDNLINMVGELVITQSMLGQLGTDFNLERLPKLLEGLSQLEQNTRELQESVMRIRMLPISFVFSRFPRMIRDLSKTLEKEVNLEIIGDQTELDKTVLEKIGDPLVHLVRNAVDHGIEKPEDRIANGKPSLGTVTLNAYHQGGNVVIEVADDGRGLDAEALKRKAIEKGLISEIEAESLVGDQAYDLIFYPGFSTAHTISDVSGRGVGMDVVKSNIQSLNGAIDLQSELGVGSKITIRLPLTLAILDGQLLRVEDQTYIFPIVSIVESLQCKPELINKVAGGCDVFRLRDEYVPIIQLAQVFNIPVENDSLDGSLMVVVESEGEKVGVVVDELLAQQQVVIKSLEQNYKRVPGVSGATILGDGRVALIVDIPGIVRLAGEGNRFVPNVPHNMMLKQHSQISNQARF